MAIVALASISGSPGVTTTAVGLARDWGRHVLLLDADPVGGAAILAGHYQGRAANPGTLVELWMAQRQGRLAQALPEVVLQMTDGVDFIPGPAGAAQAVTLSGLWPALAVELRRLDNLQVDVIIDAGRLGHTATPTPLLRMADLVLIVMRPDLVSAAAVAGMNRDVTESPLGLVVVGTGWSGGYSAAALSKTLGIGVEFELPWAPQEAASISHGTAVPGSGLLRRPRRVLRQRLRSAAQGLQWRAAQRLEELNV